MIYDSDLVLKVARLYYNENLKQESVERRLNISKYKVNRILKRAIENGIVQIIITDPNNIKKD